MTDIEEKLPDEAPEAPDAEPESIEEKDRAREVIGALRDAIRYHNYRY